MGSCEPTTWWIELLIAFACSAVGLVVFGYILLFPLKRRFINELKQKTNSELELEVFRFEPDYFDYIGQENVDVQRYKTLLNEKNLPALKKEWNKLNRSFSKLERIAGHRGRPLIMDYYNWYELAINELSSRK